MDLDHMHLYLNTVYMKIVDFRYNPANIYIVLHGFQRYSQHYHHSYLYCMDLRIVCSNDHKIFQVDNLRYTDKHLQR